MTIETIEGDFVIKNANGAAYYRHRGSLYCLLMARIYQAMSED